MNRKLPFNPKTSNLKDKYHYYLGWFEPFYSPKWVRTLSFELFEWSHSGDALCISKFLKDFAIPPTLYNEWLGQYPELKVIHEFAINSIGSNREIGALTFKFNANYVMESQAYYCEEWKTIDQWHADLKNGVEHQGESQSSFIAISESIKEKNSLIETSKKPFVALSTNILPAIENIYNEVPGKRERDPINMGVFLPIHCLSSFQHAP